MVHYAIFSLVILALGYGLLWIWRRRIDAELAEGAGVELTGLRNSDPDLVEGIDEAQFAKIYHRTLFPRFPAYAFTAVAIFLIGTPVVLGLLNAGVVFGLKWGIIPQPGIAATELYLGAGDASVVRKVNPETLSYILQGWSGFYYFFGLLAFWIGTLILVMRRYHGRTPGTLREEILRAR